MAKSVYADNKLIKSNENIAWTKLFELISPNSRVLDIGCSSGNFGKELIEQKKCEVVGIDIIDNDLKLAKRNLSAVYKRDIERDELSDLGKFDFILMADVIEHLMDPVVALKKVGQSLKPRGKLVFSVPNMANIANRIELLGGRFEYTKFGLLDETHVHYYDRVEFEKVMSRAGFTVKKYNNTIRDLPASALTSQLKKLGLAPSDKFMEMSKDIDSVTFQFIGIAEPSSQAGRHSKVESKTPHDFLNRQFDELNQAYGNRLSRLNELEIKYTDQSREKQRLSREVQRLDRELREIHSSKGWRLLSTIRAAKSGFNRVFRRK